MQNSRLQIFVRSAHPSINRAALCSAWYLSLRWSLFTDPIQSLPLGRLRSPIQEAMMSPPGQ